MPGVDLLQALRKRNEKLPSLETKTPLDSFEVLGFHLGYELTYTNFLNILSLSGIPLSAENRSNTIVLGGGIANPEPLTKFIDLFYLGEFEEIADTFVEILRKHKDKEGRLQAFSEIEGFYVPKFYSVKKRGLRYDFERKYPYAKNKINRVYVKKLDHSHYPLKWLTPHTQIIQDRAQIEIARGCPNNCTFCQAKSFYSPYREKKPQTIKTAIKEIYRSSGYENLSFLSLSVSDYSRIEEIVDENHDYLKSQRIGLSLPSLRMDSLTDKLYTKLSSLKKLSLTVALEAAHDPLRKTLGKTIQTDMLFKTAELIHSLGARQVKLYFMFGFPQENEDDLIGIGRFLGRLMRQTKLSVNASINIFIPKPFSLWENFKIQDKKILESKKAIILKNTPKTSRIKISFSIPEKSILEAVVSRADRKFSSVIYNAFSKGAVFDGHGEFFSWNIWKQAMQEEGLDYQKCLNDELENFPWSFIEHNRCSVMKN